MTILNTLLAILGTVLLLSGSGLAALCWIARGEPDVNGDPERDANPNFHP